MRAASLAALAGAITLVSCTDEQPVRSVASASQAAQLAEPGDETCGPDAQAIMSCKTGEGGEMAICSRSGSDTVPVWFQMRNADRETWEHIWPGAHDVRRAHVASVPYSGGGEAQVALGDPGQPDLVAYSRVVRTNFAAGEPNNPVFEDGVVTFRGKQPAFQFVCQQDDQLKSVDITLANERFKAQDELFWNQ